MNIKKLAEQIYELLVNEGKEFEINIKSISNMAKKLNIQNTETIKQAINYLYDVCKSDIEFTVCPSKNKFSIIKCRYNPINDSILESVKSNLALFDIKNINDKEIEFLINQFFDINGPKEYILYDICKLYFMIKKDIDYPCKYVYVSQEFLNRNNISDDLVDTILKWGYAIEEADSFRWKIYNTDDLYEDISIELFEETYSYNENKDIIKDATISINVLANKILEELGVSSREAKLLKALDDLFEEYESMEDWEKLKNSKTFLNTWKEIRKEYF